MAKITLVDAIAQLRRELYKANAASSEEELRLKVGAVEVEFEVEIEESEGDETQYGFNIWVFNFKKKSGEDLSDKRLHRVKLHLTPELNEQDLHISGEAKPSND